MTGTEKIRDHMDVICSCGKRLGTVDRVEGDSIKLTKSDPEAGGRHHWVPLDWVDHVDNQVHLNRNSEEAEQEWEEEAPLSV